MAYIQIQCKAKTLAQDENRYLGQRLVESMGCGGWHAEDDSLMDEGCC